MNPVVTSFALQSCSNNPSLHSFGDQTEQIPPPLPPKVSISAFSPRNNKTTVTPAVLRKCVCLCVCVCVMVQPKLRTSSEESVAGEEERLRKPSSLQAPSPLIRTSSETRARPTFQPRSSRNSGAFPGEQQLKKMNVEAV